MLWARWRGWLGVTMFDVAAVPLALGNAIGRIGCQLSGDGDYGKAWNGPWAMGYPNGTVPTDPGVTVHPTPIYETLAMGLIAWLLWTLRDRVRPGVLFALWLVLAGLERLLVEFLRRNAVEALGLTLPQLQSVAMIAGGLVWIALVRRRHGSALLAARRARIRASRCRPRRSAQPSRGQRLQQEAHAQVLQLVVVLDRAMVAAGDAHEARRRARPRRAPRRARRECAIGTCSSPSACSSSSGQARSAAAASSSCSARNASSAGASAANSKRPARSPRAQAARARRADRDDGARRPPARRATSAR